MKRYTLAVTLLSLTCFILPLHAQDEEKADIDEWQTLKVEAARDPFVAPT